MSNMLSTALVLLAALTSAQAFELNSLFATPNPALQPQAYDGFEIRLWRVTFRPALFQIEFVLLAFLGAYLTTYVLGKRTNTSRAHAWLAAHAQWYATQFSNAVNGDELVSDGPMDFVAYSSGRRGVESLHTTFSLLPRHDLLKQLWNFGWGMVWLDWEPRDEISLDFTINVKDVTTPGFVWSVVNKDELRQLRTDRWDLNLFTKTTDAVPVHSSIQVMTEFSDINTMLLKSGAAPSLLAALNNPEALKYFRALVITDQPYTRPETFEVEKPIPSLLTRPRHIILTLSLPPVSEASSTLPIVQAVFELVDVLYAINAPSPLSSSSSTTIADTTTAQGSAGGLVLPGNHPARQHASLQPETVRKLRTTRREWDDRLEKERVSEQVAEEEERKRKEKRKEEEDRLAKLSAGEQAKILEKERKRNLRKAQMRVSRK